MSNITLHNHHSPYYPQDLRLPHYVPNTLTTPELISRFAAYCVVIVTGTLILVGSVLKKRLTTYEKVVATWFMLCKLPTKYHKNIRSGNPANLLFGAAGGFIHLFFEGYFGYTASRIAGNTHLFAQLWKEYALSDSRYMSYDAFTVAMERVTAVRSPGPLSNRSPVTMYYADLLGPALVLPRIRHCDIPSSAVPTPDHRIARPALRRRAVLCNSVDRDV